MNVFPDFDGLSGISELREVAGALLMFVLVVAVLMLIVSAICWAIGAANGNYQVATKGPHRRVRRPRRARSSPAPASPG